MNKFLKNKLVPLQMAADRRLVETSHVDLPVKYIVSNTRAEDDCSDEWCVVSHENEHQEEGECC